jgi:hypothetical protein
MIRLRIAGLSPIAAALAATLVVATGTAAASPVDSLAALKAQRARAILERAAEQAGGLEAWRATRDVSFILVMRGFTDGVPGPAESSMVTFRLHGSRQYREVAPDGSELGSDGTVGWSLRGGKVSVARADSLMAMYQATTIPLWFEVPFRFLDPDFSVTHLGSIDVGGRPCEVVQALEKVPGRRLSQCNAYCAYFDAATGRMLGSNLTRVEVGESQPRLAAWFDEPVGAGRFTMPAVMRLYALGQSLLPDLSAPLLEYRRESIRFGVDAPDSTFRVPAR